MVVFVAGVFKSLSLGSGHCSAQSRLSNEYCEMNMDVGADRLGLSFISCLVPIISWNPTFLFCAGNFNASTVGLLRRVDIILLKGLGKVGL